MVYFYHIVPEEIKGNILYPLNSLKKKYPSVYNNEVEKYVGREIVMKTKIPFLNCLWNDVLHLTAVPPSKIIEELKKAGCELTKIKWYKIDVENLDPKKLIVYLYKYKEGYSHSFNKEDFKDFELKDLKKYQTIPSATKKYYVQEIRGGERPFMFHLVPHILYKGSIDISVLEIIET